MSQSVVAIAAKPELNSWIFQPQRDLGTFTWEEATNLSWQCARTDIKEACQHLVDILNISLNPLEHSSFVLTMLAFNVMVLLVSHLKSLQIPF
jgi:hypothetical protein